jgi:hypothetical protein
VLETKRERVKEGEIENERVRNIVRKREKETEREKRVKEGERD